MPNSRIVADGSVMKVCCKCRLDLPVSSYTLCASHSDGMQRVCKGCARVAFLSYKERHPKRRAATVKRWKKENAEHVRESRRGRQYRMTPGQYAEMTKEQNDSCAICHKHRDACCGQTLNVDHCHITGKIRGLLCKKCNLLLGHIDDRLDLLRNMTAYMEKHA